MSKAEERAFEYYPNIDRKDYPCKELDAAYREVFMLGYHQAEKDLELTWEDISNISECLSEVEEEITVGQHKGCGLKGMYQEVLNRFNKQRKKY